MTDVAVILVGGFGTRLRSVVSDVPKPLAPIDGKPFLFILLEKLSALQFKTVILLTGYMHEKIVDACGDGSQFGLTIFYSHEKEPAGTAGALKLAEPLLRKITRTNFVLLNGDSYCPEALIATTKLHNTIETIGTIIVSYVQDASRFGTIHFDPMTNNILLFQEKSHQNSGYVNTGVYHLSHTIFNHIPANEQCSLEQDVFPSLLISAPHQLKARVINAEFDDIGLPESYHAFIKKTS